MSFLTSEKSLNGKLPVMSLVIICHKQSFYSPHYAPVSLCHILAMVMLLSVVQSTLPMVVITTSCLQLVLVNSFNAVLHSLPASRPLVASL